MLQNVPGLRVVAPGTPADVDAAFHIALTGDDPTIIVDNYALAHYEGPVGSVPADISRPTLLRDGADVLIVTYSLMAQHALSAATLLADSGISVGVLNVAQVAPLPAAELLAATEGHDVLLFVDESRAAGSPASHMMARVLQARQTVYARLACTLDAPMPFAPHLVDELVPGPDRIAAEVLTLVGR
jgi:pyruvate/2-oxoglutarate/acetoin dehydrogenase E1 component